jgi:tetratricopeptide (TPR) repeat protein
LGRVLFDRGDRDRGLRHIQQANRFAPESSGIIASLGFAYAVSGLTQKARECLDKLRSIANARYVPAMDFATVYAGLGDADAVFASLEQAFTERCVFLTWLKVLPEFKPLRRDPRFHSILRRLGLVDG